MLDLGLNRRQIRYMCMRACGEVVLITFPFQLTNSIVLLQSLSSKNSATDTFGFIKVLTDRFMILLFYYPTFFHTFMCDSF